MLFLVELHHVKSGVMRTHEAGRAFIEYIIFPTFACALLLCLDRKLRLTFILSHVFGTNSVDGAHILDISPAAFRKRLSRARGLVMDFMKKKCGLFNLENPCRCTRQVSSAEKRGLINSEKLVFATHPSKSVKDLPNPDQLRQMDEFQRLAVLFRSHPDYEAPAGLLEHLKSATANPYGWHVACFDSMRNRGPAKWRHQKLPPLLTGTTNRRNMA